MRPIHPKGRARILLGWRRLPQAADWPSAEEWDCGPGAALIDQERGGAVDLAPSPTARSRKVIWITGKTCCQAVAPTSLG
jgi:hypothetical protein